MIPRILIFYSIIFITNTRAMEIIKKIKLKKEHKYNNNDSILNTLFLTRKITEKQSLPEDVTQHIILYHVLCHTASDNKYIDTLPDIVDYTVHLKKNFKEAWFAHDTPIIDYYYTTSEQKNLMKNILPTQRVQTEIHRTICFLNSSKEYKLFITLPKKLRENFAHYCMDDTIGIIQKKHWYSADVQFNGRIVKCKWITPENKDKKVQFAPMILTDDSLWYCIQL